MGPRNQGEPEEIDDQRPMERQISFSDDSFCSSDEEDAIVEVLTGKHIAKTGEIVAATGLEKGQSAFVSICTHLLKWAACTRFSHHPLHGNIMDRRPGNQCCTNTTPPKES